MSICFSKTRSSYCTYHIAFRNKIIHFKVLHLIKMHIICRHLPIFGSYLYPISTRIIIIINRNNSSDFPIMSSKHWCPKIIAT